MKKYIAELIGTFALVFAGTGAIVINDTFFLMFVILTVSTGAKEKGVMAGAAIGAVVGLEALFAGPVSGASMNPARSLAPALAAGHIEHLWIYVLAPVIGAGLAVAGCRCVQKPGCCSSLPQPAQENPS